MKNSLYLLGIRGSLAVALLCATCLSQAVEWPQYRGPQHDGTTEDSIAVTDWQENQLRQLWKVPTPKGFSSFSVTQGKAFTLIGQDDADGVSREVCVALDAETGQELWRAVLGIADYDGGGDSGAPDNRGGDGPRSMPTIDGGNVYVFDSRLGLYCLSVSDGKIIWQKDIIKEHAGRNIRWQSAASPLIDGDLLYVVGGGAGESFLALNKSDGAVVWKGQDELMTHATAIPATIHDVRQIIFFAQSGLISVDAKTGKELWRFDYQYTTSTAASPVVYGDLVYCSAGYGVGAAVYRINKTDDGYQPEQIWRKRNKLQSHWSTPVCKDGYLYGMFGFKKYGKAPMKCVEMATGEEMWSQDGYGPGNCILAGDFLVALADNGELALVEATPTAYKERSRLKVVDGKCWSTPTLSDGRLYIRSVSEGVCLDVSAPASQ